MSRFTGESAVMTRAMNLISDYLHEVGEYFRTSLSVGDVLNVNGRIRTVTSTNFNGMITINDGVKKHDSCQDVVYLAVVTTGDEHLTKIYEIYEERCFGTNISVSDMRGNLRLYVDLAKKQLTEEISSV